MIQLTTETIDVQAVINTCEAQTAGAINVFIGTVRDHSAGKKVIKLEYEAYDKMAVAKMEWLATEARKRWPIEAVAMVHRKGLLQIGEVAVVVAVATPHRKDAFEACQWLIDTLKEIVPIWKKETYVDGQVWVAAHA